MLFRKFLCGENGTKWSNIIHVWSEKKAVELISNTTEQINNQTPDKNIPESIRSIHDVERLSSGLIPSGSTDPR